MWYSALGRGGVLHTRYTCHAFRCSRLLPVESRRTITKAAAKKILGLSSDHKPTMRELRAAYFDAAKQTHPDVIEREGQSDGKDFVQVTKAYEILLTCRDIENDVTWKISRSEEEEYRKACDAILGVPAEIVEESKQNPMFRHWLGGNTDGAQHWRAFFATHGGLAQKLRIPVAYIPSGQQETTGLKVRPRRRRK